MSSNYETSDYAKSVLENVTLGCCMFFKEKKNSFKDMIHPQKHGPTDQAWDKRKLRLKKKRAQLVTHFGWYSGLHNSESRSRSSSPALGKRHNTAEHRTWWRLQRQRRGAETRAAKSLRRSLHNEH